MSDNIPKKDKQEIIPEKREIDKLDQPDYRYGFDQEPIDSKRLKNKGFGDRKPLVDNTTYYADQSGFITATATAAATTTITGYNGITSTLTSGEIVALGAVTSSAATTGQPNITFRVNKGTYYKVDSTSGIYIAYFTPLH